MCVCLCAHVLGEGQMGVKVRKKRSERQTKAKVKKKGGGDWEQLKKKGERILPKSYHSTLKDLF